MPSLQALPAELLAAIFSNLDLSSLLNVAYTSSTLRGVCTDPVTNPWRRPMLRALHQSSEDYSALLHLSVRSCVPRQNWVDILSRASPSFILFEATLPNLRDDQWREAFVRRFLPSWQGGRRPIKWSECFKRSLFRVSHRSITMCTTEQAWTQYLVLNKNGSANALEASSRTFNPLAIMDNIKLQSNLRHLPTKVRLIAELADVRILALGIYHRPSGPFYVNKNALSLLQEPRAAGRDHGTGDFDSARPLYPLMETPKENRDFRDVFDDGWRWLGGMMLVAQIVGPHSLEVDEQGISDDGLHLVSGPGRRQYASLHWSDLWAVAPWMRARVTKTTDGAAL